MQADTQKSKTLQDAATRDYESPFSYSIQQENALGSTIRIVDAQTGNGMLRFRYDVFGKVHIAHEGTPNNYTYYNSVMLRFLYTGREMLATAGGIGAGLMDYRNRIYSPTLGRFLQPDPIGFEAGDVNWYRYVGNNVVNFTDPEGLRLPGVWNLFNPTNPAKNAKEVEICNLIYEHEHDWYGCPEKMCYYRCYTVYHDIIVRGKERYKTINVDAHMPCPENG